MSVEVIILAAGKGTRMRSELPKVLHTIAGKPMLAHVIDTVDKIGAEKIHVVIGHGAERVRASIQAEGVAFVLQEQQLGTGHAVDQAMPAVDDSATVLIAYGDVPLVEAQTLEKLVANVSTDVLSLLTVNLANPTGYGRIVRDERGDVKAIVEQKDATEEQLLITEVNTGILAVAANKLKSWLPKLSADNAQGEYYLTDIIEMAVNDGMSVNTSQPANPWEVEGVNNRLQQHELERIYQANYAKKLMLEGVALADAARIDIRGSLTVGSDVFIDVNCLFIGDVVLGDGVSVGPNCVIEDSRIGASTVVKANSIVEQSSVGEHCDIGPFARLRPGTELSDKAKIGNFVETKKAKIGKGAKVNHLTYIGDADIGERVNVGAGTITCNYDGVNKHKTVIGDDSFIGSNSSLVAPVSLGEGVTIGAGSTITEDVLDGQLSVARARQKNLRGRKRPTKQTST